MSEEEKATGESASQTLDGPETTWVEIATASTQEEALLLKGFLENEGIPCQEESLKFDELPVNVGAMGEIRVYVPEAFEAAARQQLNYRQAQYDRLDEDGESVVTDEGPATISDDSESGDPDEV